MTDLNYDDGAIDSVEARDPASKPKIYRATNLISDEKAWFCSGLELIAIGETVVEAYENWLSRINDGSERNWITYLPPKRYDNDWTIS